MPDIIITVPNQKLADFKNGILSHAPIPLNNNGQPLFSDLDWVKKILTDVLMTMYREGKRKIARDLVERTIKPEIDENVIS